MSRYTGPAYKKSRRVGISTLENGIGTFFYEHNVKNAKQFNADDYR